MFVNQFGLRTGMQSDNKPQSPMKILHAVAIPELS